MTSSRSSSASRRLGPALAALLLAGCAGARPVPEPGPPPRFVLFPVQNVTGGPAPSREIAAALRLQLLSFGVQLVPDEEVRAVLSARRVRYTGGLDRELAAALRAETGAAGVLVASLEMFDPSPPYRFAMTVRLATTGPDPRVAWIDAVARTGVDAPGLFGIGVTRSMELLRDQALQDLAASFARSTEKPRPVAACPSITEVAPRRMFRAPVMGDPSRRTIAAFPFLNDTKRRDAGEVLLLRFLAPLVASGAVEVVEPGVVRGELLAHRIGSTGGLSLDDARITLQLVKADLVLSGAVRRFDDVAGTGAAPALDFSSWVLDGETGQLAWSATSSGAGDDGVYFFGIGRVLTPSGLACGMAKGAVRFMIGDRPPLGREAPPAGFAPRKGAGAVSASM